MQRKKIDHYTIFLDKKLGEGSFGKVYRGIQNETKEPVAIKILEKNKIDQNAYYKKALDLQVEISSIVKSDNIVKFYDILQSANNYYFTQQLCQSGDLAQLIKAAQKFDQKEAISYLKQICNGFVALLKQGVIHRDLKPGNILIHNGVLKICDFGFSKRIKNQNAKNQTMIGTPLYKAIEILKCQPYSSKCDIWSIGIIFYELLTGKTPWVGISQYALINNILKKPIEFPSNISDFSKDFIRKCLEIQQNERMSWDQLFRHPIFNGYFTQFIKQKQQFENKLMRFMRHLSIKIKFENINLQQLLKQLGYKRDSDLNFDDFQKFINQIDTDVTPQQLRYIYQQLDEDKSDSISFIEIEKSMKKYTIQNLNSKIKKESSNNSTHEISSILKQSQLKVARAFKRMYSRLKNKNISIEDVFQAFDVNGQGNLNLQQFSEMIKKLDDSFTNEELEIAFDLIDIDKTKTIQLDQFYDYFAKVNGNFNNSIKKIQKQV